MVRRVSFKLTKYSFKESVAYSFMATAIFCLIFLIAKLLHIEKDVDVHYLNYFAAFFVAFLATKKVFETNNREIEYYNTFMIGVTTVVLAQLWYSIIFFIYLQFDKDMLVFLNSLTPHNIIAPHLSISVILFSEGWSKPRYRTSTH